MGKQFFFREHDSGAPRFDALAEFCGILIHEPGNRVSK
jgi:hypothetical protein